MVARKDRFPTYSPRGLRLSRPSVSSFEEFVMPSNIKMLMRVFTLVVALLMLAEIAPADTQSLETLLAYLKSPNAGTRQDAARRLGERRERNQLAVEALAVAARKDEDQNVREEAVNALGKLKDFTALPEMIDALKDSRVNVRN